MKNHELLSSIEILRYRYRNFSKKKKGEVLKELERTFVVDRKYLVRLLARTVGGETQNPLQGRKALEIWRPSLPVCSA